MDVKEEDKSEESKARHLAYYRSLARVIAEIQGEKEQEGDPTVLKHLDGRIEAMEKDKKRIREMFPDISEEEWNVDPN